MTVGIECSVATGVTCDRICARHLPFESMHQTSHYYSVCIKVWISDSEICYALLTQVRHSVLGPVAEGPSALSFGLRPRACLSWGTENAQYIGALPYHVAVIVSWCCQVWLAAAS